MGWTVLSGKGSAIMDKQEVKQLINYAVEEIDQRQIERMRLATILGFGTVVFVASVFYVIGRINKDYYICDCGCCCNGESECN